jgi:cobyrinic acid a,c-diamide synthase
VPESDFIFLPGGYPELYAEKLAENRQFLESVKEAAKDTNIYGECGGYMALGESLIDSDGKSHKMLDLLDLVTSIELPKLTLGYRKLRTLSWIHRRYLHGTRVSLCENIKS